jgi:hypothetical protein
MAIVKKINFKKIIEEILFEDTVAKIGAGELLDFENIFKEKVFEYFVFDDEKEKLFVSKMVSTKLGDL